MALVFPKIWFAYIGRHDGLAHRTVRKVLQLSDIQTK